MICDENAIGHYNSQTAERRIALEEMSSGLLRLALKRRLMPVTDVKPDRLKI